jgi:signal transduction histidine kinase
MASAPPTLADAATRVDADASESPRVVPRRRRTVAGRLLGSSLVVFVVFAITVAWTVSALRAGARDAELLRGGYVPMSLRIGEAFAEQNLFNAQLNHITEKNASYVRDWVQTKLRIRSPRLKQIREAAESGLVLEADASVRKFREEVAEEANAIEKLSAADPERFAQLDQALRENNLAAAERAQKDLIDHGTEAAHRLKGLKARVEERMQSLTAAAKHREEQSLQLLGGLALLALVAGLLTSLYARRVLAPLTVVTDRAEAVARGDLTPRAVVATNDEIGELATTFEGMVAAIQRARAELVQAERLATIGKMAAHITHEIRNPLSAIGLNVELLEEEIGAASERDESKQLVGAIKGEVDRLSRIAEQYLSVARRPRPNLQKERVDDLVKELVSFVRPELDKAGVKSTVVCDDTLPEVELDESQLRQALLNLIRNAREAMTTGGELAISVTATEGGVTIRIDDDGPGIPADVRANIFDPFFTTKQRGTGLGLAVTREIVETHHGTILCEPRSPRGTRFEIQLPAAS